MTPRTHAWNAYPGALVPCACGCGTLITSPDNRGRARKFSRGHNLRIDHPLHRPGVVNWWKGRHLTDEARAKLSIAHSKPKPYLRGPGNGMYGRTGESNPNWKGGVTPERQRLYANGDWKYISQWIFARDGYACTKCGARNRGWRSLHVHHIKPWATHPELRFDLDNLTTLCRDCHHAAHRRGGDAA